MSRGALPLAGLEVHQLLPTFTPGDAMGAAAIGFSRALRLQGALGWVYAGERAAQYGALVRPASELRPAPDALVLYHHGIASLLSGRLAHLNCRRGVVFHNVTPARFYEGTRLEEPLRAGRAQLAAMAKSVDVSLGVSQYNVRELEVAGHSNVHRVPLFLEPARFSAAAADARLRTRLVAGGRPVVVSVSRVVPHKRAEDVLSLHAELRRLAPEARLVIIGAYAPGQKPFRALARRAKAIGGVSLLGHVSHAELVAAYRSADVFVSMSEHEGFGVPLLEAMACEVPVLAFGASAVPETMGGAGLVFDEKHFAALAEVVMLLQHDTAMREAVVAGQRARVAQFSLEATSAALANALKEFAPKPKALPRRKRPKVAVVVQRYGPDITGGAEAHARQVVERLAEHVEVEVLTTCATDHFTWANELPEGLELDGGTRVERFAVTRTRKMLGFNRLSDSLFGQSLEAVAEERWLCEQGPLAPGLLEALRTRGTSWNAAIFFTYLYQPTAWGVPLVGDRALVVPTAHDEPPFRFEIFGDALTHAQALLCNTPEEEALIRGRFPHAARSRVAWASSRARATGRGFGRTSA